MIMICEASSYIYLLNICEKHSKILTVIIFDSISTIALFEIFLVAGALLQFFSVVFLS